MGLLTDIINQKMQRHTQQQALQKQAELQYYHDAMTNAPSPEAAAHFQNLYEQSLDPQGKKHFQKAHQLRSVFQNVLGTDEHGRMQPVGQGAALESPVQQGMGGAPAENGTSVNGTNYGAGAELQGAGPTKTELGQPEAAAAPPSKTLTDQVQPNAPPPGFPGMLASPIGDTAHSDQTPAAAPPQPYVPSPQDNFNTFSKYGQQETGQNVNLKLRGQLADRVLGPAQGTPDAIRQEIMLGMPATSIQEKAKLQAQRESAASVLDDLEKRGIKVPDTVKAEILASRNLGVASLLRPTWSPAVTRGSMLQEKVDALGNPVDPNGDYRIRMDGAGNQAVYPAEIAQRIMQGENQTMVGVNPYHPEAPATTIQGAVSPSANRVILTDKVGGGRGAEIGSQAVAGVAPTTIPDTIGRGNPVTTTREQVVTLAGPNGQQAVAVPVTGTRQVGGPVGSTGGAAAPSPAATKPASQGSGAGGAVPQSSTPPANAPVGPRGARVLGPRGLTGNQLLGMKNAIELASHQLYGDPDNPALRPLNSYAKLADDPGARERIGKALKMLLDAGGDAGAAHLGAAVGPISVSAGGVGDLLQYTLGVPQAVADAKAKAIRGVIEDMKPEEVDYFNALMNAIPTITGLRKLTSSGAFQWTQAGLERELPMIGLAGVTNSDTFRKKMTSLGDEPLTAIQNVNRVNPGAIDPKLISLIKGASVRQQPVNGLNNPTTPKTAADYLKSVGMGK